MNPKTAWQDISYLLHGTERQRAVYRVLNELEIFEVLCDFNPTLVGTIPLNIDVEGSDLDIICQAHDLAAFKRRVVAAFEHQEGFRITEKEINGRPTVMAKFQHGGFPIEIFGQPRPVEEQNAYRHMAVEAELLQIGGEEAWQEIRRLKRAGLKTEPAFAAYYNLEGDPYQMLLELSQLDVDELRKFISAPVRN